VSADLCIQSDDRLASWAHDVVADPPERHLGELADWAADVVASTTDFAENPGAEQAPGTAERARPTGESSAGAPLRPFGAVASSSGAGDRRPLNRAAMDEARVRSSLYGARSGLVVSSTIRPPVVGS
jgi:hypothetical protein